MGASRTILSAGATGAAGARGSGQPPAARLPGGRAGAALHLASHGAMLAVCREETTEARAPVPRRSWVPAGTS